MKKAIGQTVRELKREVNKKVLKVPGIEQKVLDATSNEAWGPHGSLLADIAQATRDFHECQMIMAVIWKRINDSGKNWRHVYKALIVLEYLLANGAERVIEDIREHTHLISTLSSFQYIDSSGRDQGNNIRKKSQSFVLLVNDKERIIEVRQQAAANRDKFHNNSTSGMYKLGSYSSSGTYGDRYDDDRHGSKEDDRSGYGISREKEWGYRDDDRNSRGGDYYGRDNEEHNSREGYRDDEYNGSSAKAEDHSLEGRLEREASEKNVAAPPSYEEAASQSPLQNERDGEISGASAPRGSSPVSDNPHQTYASTGSSLVRDNPMDETAAATTVTAGSQEVGTWDEFDPRGPVSAAPAVADNVEMDLFSSLSDPFSSNALALVPSSSATTTHQGFANLDSTPSFPQPLSGSHKLNPVPLFEDPFGDSPFKAVPSPETAPFPPQMHQNLEPSELSGPNTENVSNFGFGDSFSVVPYSTSSVSDTQLVSSNSQFLPQYLSSPPQEPDILADILPPAPLSGITSQHNFSAPPSYAQSLPSFSASSGQMASQYFLAQSGQLMQQGFSAYQASQFNSRNFIAQQGNVPGGKQSDVVGSLLGEGVNAPNVCQPSNDKFETKSTVWADTLSRGLVNLNISGPKINPLADIGIDFDAINRKEKRMEKPTTVPLTSNVTMGKAMGSGSGIGRVGANALKPPSNPMMGPGVGMGMGGYGAINVPIMGMGTRQGIQMQPPSALPPGSNVAGNYNSMMGTGGYHQQPYGGGGGYR